MEMGREINSRGGWQRLLEVGIERVGSIWRPVGWRLGTREFTEVAQQLDLSEQCCPDPASADSAQRTAVSPRTCIQRGCRFAVAAHPHQRLALAQE